MVYRNAEIFLPTFLVIRAQEGGWWGGRGLSSELSGPGSSSGFLFSLRKELLEAPLNLLKVEKIVGSLGVGDYVS